MHRFKKLFRLIPMIALAVVATSCDNIGEPTEPTLGPSPMVVTSTSGEKYTVAVELLPTKGEVSASIGTGGGVLVLGRHFLTIAPGAVSAPTQFKMVRDAENPLRVELTATRNTENDIGSQGFNASVKLGISYFGTVSTPLDLNSMKILYFRPDGLVEVMPSWVQVGNYLVTAELQHFSQYGLGFGGNGGF